MRRPGRRRLLVALGALGALAGSVATRAATDGTGSDAADGTRDTAARSRAEPPAGADWPPPRIRLVVAYPVGGLSSEVARLIADERAAHRAWLTDRR